MPSWAVWGAALSNEGGSPGFGEWAGMEGRNWQCFARARVVLGTLELEEKS